METLNSSDLEQQNRSLISSLSLPTNVILNKMEIALAFGAHELAKLRRIVSLAEKLIEKGASKGSGVAATKRTKRVRRTGQELVRFRNMLKTARKKGVPVSELARKHGISTAYIYALQ